MEFYFVKRDVIIMLHKQFSFDLTKISQQNLDTPKHEIPDGKNIGDQCLFNVEDPLKDRWTYGKIVWHDFNLLKYNEANNTDCVTNEFKSKYYLFTPFKGRHDELSTVFRSLSDFVNDYQISVKGGLIILPDDKMDSDEELFQLDIFLPVTSQIPKKLLQEYLPRRIRRKNYNFYTY
ncbi:MAG: hypothetical protein GPJ54_10850 [Candidatus Heimdallarchaeota archaeon]|nr:hypothetical protein [Candidatus Heimdallarchaeota archaeon]